MISINYVCSLYQAYFLKRQKFVIKKYFVYKVGGIYTQ